MAEDDSVFKVFTIFMATCKSNGISPVSPVFIGSITKKPIDEIMRCIKVLESPDPLSRSTTDDGRRIRKVDGGYFLINYKKYRDFTYSDNPEAVRKRKYREERDNQGHVPDDSKCPGHSASASASSSASENRGVGEETKTWRTDFLTYQKEESEAYQKIINDKEWLDKQEKLKIYLDLNVLKSLEKAHEYWSSEEGWKYKARKKSAKIIWSSTYANALSMRWNMVFNPKGTEPSKPQKPQFSGISDDYYKKSQQVCLPDGTPFNYETYQK